jgi:hypothetical protein
VLFAVLKHINEGIPDLTGAGQRTAMPTICPKSSAPKQEPIHTPRNANLEPTHATRQYLLALRLDNQTQMIVLD